MDYLHTIIMGIMQGLTEFLPVSSSGHIVLTSVIYKLITGQDFSVATDEEVFFDIMLHIGTLIAVCIYFRKEIVSVLKALFTSIKTKSFNNYKSMLGIYIIVSTFFTGIIGVFIKDTCEKLLTMPVIVGCALIVTGLILLGSEFLFQRAAKKITTVGIKEAILIGIAQGFAALPGISRSGSTIATAIAFGVDRTNAARYSFLISIPVMALVFILSIPDIIRIEMTEDLSWGPMVIGTIVSGIVGYLCVKYFILYLRRFSLNIFAYYCMLAGLATIICFKFVL